MTSISSSSSSSSSSNNSKNKSISPLTNFINENCHQQQFSEFPKIEENQKDSTSQVTQQQIQLLEMLAKAGLIPNSLPNKQEDEQKSVQSNNESNLFGSNSLLNNLSVLPNTLFSEKQSEKDLSEEGGQLGQRKRRRLIGNLDNTLDGLVAKRADQMPLKKRYQSETEAIELPDDEQEIKRMETDPDVCTRMCSVCGYQGKWVSEMIRHKRVHTNDRPFKCKYCNRTSKWKADLIRHVAKTHGIRVVSKYSRSKAFDFGKNSNKSLLPTEQQLTIDDVIMDVTTDDDNNCSSEISTNVENNNDEQINNKNGRKQSTSSSSNFSESLNSMFRKAQRLNGLVNNNNCQIQNKNKKGQQKIKKEINLNKQNNSNVLINLFGGISQQLANKQLINATIREQLQQQLLDKSTINKQKIEQKQIYKCGLCIFQQTSYPLLVSHLLGVHNTSPFSCQSCNLSFTQIVSAGEHFSSNKCPPLSLKWNFLVDSFIGNEHFETNQQNPFNLFGQHLASNNILFNQNIRQNNISANFGGLLPPNIFPYGLPTMAFPQHLTSPSIAQIHGIGQNCCSPGSAISTAPSYASLINDCEKQKQLEENSEDNDNIEILEDLNKKIKSSKSPELKIPAPITTTSNFQFNSSKLQHSPLEAETANKNEQNLENNEDFCVNVDDIKIEEKSGDELQNDDIKNTSLAALMILNAVQMQQKLTATEENKPKTILSSQTKQEQLICPTTSTTTNNNPSLAAFSQFLAELQHQISSANFQ
uniref:C2H2-type domain-containing protein n=1 Tax=Meloidogyne hapla TaxID=6305 RepID=A0A1I8B2E4_MELHA